jgi:hypothetical protein
VITKIYASSLMLVWVAGLLAMVGSE